MERRSYLEITAEILDAAMNGERKTHIAYRANLNHAILENYLQKLEGQGLVTRENGLKEGSGPHRKGFSLYSSTERFKFSPTFRMHLPSWSASSVR